MCNYLIPAALVIQVVTWGTWEQKCSVFMRLLMLQYLPKHLWQLALSFVPAEFCFGLIHCLPHRNNQYKMTTMKCAQFEKSIQFDSNPCISTFLVFILNLSVLQINFNINGYLEVLVSVIHNHKEWICGFLSPLEKSALCRTISQQLHFCLY